ncbi:MAG: Holliday junction resolvase RuvX [Armatimonadota bacterium]|nr:Holliday junction resolvase RuvX [Armatimonadota bacterium]
MSRTMALDVGDKTIGVAISDPLGITAEPLTVLRRGESVKADLRAVEELIAQYDVSRVVVGLPIMLGGEEGVQAAKVREFVERLSKRARVPVVTWDERLTTAEAERALLEADASREKRKRVIDKVAAAIILRSYLAANKE